MLHNAYLIYISYKDSKHWFGSPLYHCHVHSYGQETSDRRTAWSVTETKFLSHFTAAKCDFKIVNSPALLSSGS
jgi:hypothetical protein